LDHGLQFKHNGAQQHKKKKNKIKIGEEDDDEDYVSAVHCVDFIFSERSIQTAFPLLQKTQKKLI